MKATVQGVCTAAAGVVFVVCIGALCVFAPVAYAATEGQTVLTVVGSQQVKQTHQVLPVDPNASDDGVDLESVSKPTVPAEVTPVELEDVQQDMVPAAEKGNSLKGDSLKGASAQSSLFAQTGEDGRMRAALAVLACMACVAFGWAWFERRQTWGL